MQSTEQWRPVLGWEGRYEISDQGRVRSIDRIDHRGYRLRGRARRVHTRANGYQLVTFTKDGSVHGRYVHRMVLEAFAGPCPEGMEGCHNDGNPSNNRANNLRWDTPSANGYDKVAHGTWTNQNIVKDLCKRGHRLVAPNLIEGRLGDGRVCKACQRGRVFAHRAGIRLTKEIADRYYMTSGMEQR